MPFSLPLNNPFSGMSIFPGDQDWQRRIGFGGGIFGQQGGDLGTPGTTPATGSWADRLAQKLESPGAQLGLRILANNRGGQSLGNVLGSAALGYQQDKAQAGMADLQRKLLEAQIARMNQPEKVDRGRLVVVAGPDGKPRYQYEGEAAGQSPYQDPTQASSQAGSIQEYEAAKATGFKGTYLDFLKSRTQATTQQPQPEPLVAIQTADGRSILVPRSQAVGASPAAPRENFVPTEGERTAGNYFGRMEAAEKLLGDYVPLTMDYIAADRMMKGGPTMGSLANLALSTKGQQYYQAAADWVRAKLRKESGAVISPEEMSQEIKTYFPLPGDGKEVIAQKKQARQQAMQGMKDMSGRAVPAAPASATAPNDPLGIR